MMDAPALRGYLTTHFTRTLFRLETLPSYDVPSDGGDLARYLAGEPEPTPERKRPWLDRLRDEASRGLRRRRVRVLTTPLGDYLRYECEWSYLPNAQAGEDIRVLELAGDAGGPRLAELIGSAGGDFYLLDDEHLIRMHYTASSQPLGAEAVTSPDAVSTYRHIAQTTWAAAEPFGLWWARHPQYHRAHWTA